MPMRASTPICSTPDGSSFAVAKAEDAASEPNRRLRRRGLELATDELRGLVSTSATRSPPPVALRVRPAPRRLPAGRLELVEINGGGSRTLPGNHGDDIVDQDGGSADRPCLRGGRDPRFELGLGDDVVGLVVRVRQPPPSRERHRRPSTGPRAEIGAVILSSTSPPARPARTSSKGAHGLDFMMIGPQNPCGVAIRRHKVDGLPSFLPRAVGRTSLCARLTKP